MTDPTTDPATGPASDAPAAGQTDAPTPGQDDAPAPGQTDALTPGQADVGDALPAGPATKAADLDDAPPASYAAAEAELEQILAALEDEGVDVDQLSGHVQRAKALITWCRARVASAEVTITELLADGEPPRAGGAED